MILDLGDSVSVQTFASDVSSQFSKVDCLICNAGVLVPNVPDVIETDFDTNQFDENEEETAVWYQGSDEQSAQTQDGGRYICISLSNVKINFVERPIVCQTFFAL